MIHNEAWYREASDLIRRWDDPSYLPAQVDEIDRNLQRILHAAHPLLSAIMQAPRYPGVEIPFRAREFAKRLYLELKEQADHVDRFLNKKTLWNPRRYQQFLKELEGTKATISQFYGDMVPYLERLQARLPLEQEHLLLEALQPEIIDVEFEESE